MNGEDWGWLGGGIGGIIGVLGAIYGVRASLKHAKGSAERRLVWRFSLAILVLIGLLMAGIFLIPPPYNWLTWIPYAIVLVVSIQYANRMQARLRETAPPANV